MAILRLIQDDEVRSYFSNGKGGASAVDISVAMAQLYSWLPSLEGDMRYEMDSVVYSAWISQIRDAGLKVRDPRTYRGIPVRVL